ncbi:ATP-binding protein [Nocardiopsis sp. RSe5-2]|uniref:ATP-binding protein n=1 Tax=Nocardiopsis endophytica TaxID=3018445 RepID=A0ABT4U1P4_9ACTN|nr:ATP-binding protein [Nocardiopsis endophytica]MDA2810869.1 ATP-binding protein [Nocardiopsis endophytica]
MDLPLPRTYSSTFHGLADQVPAARRWLERALVADAATSDTAFTACLLLSELATNSIRHTASGMPGGLFSVIAVVDAERLRVSVHDQGGPGVPVIRAHPAALGLHRGGRGLGLVDALAAAWDTHTGPTGRTVWFEVLLK